MSLQPPPPAPYDPAPARVDVSTGTSTSRIWVADGLAERLAAWLDAEGVGRRRVVVSSPRVWRHHGATFAPQFDAPPILVPDGERAKTLGSVSKIYDALIARGADRGSVLVAIGGGVLGDTAGFAAATFLRGIALVQVPTTLLAQVDSAIGGKVGVNHPLGKNLIGAFHQAAHVVVDPALLRTLPRREFRSGLYEVVKYGVIASRPLFERLSTHVRAVFRHDPAVLVPAIVESCGIKAGVVSRDEREGGLRRILNFGHTIGHALEAVTHYRRFRHGEAIAHGMRAAADLSAARGVLPDGDRAAIDGLLSALGSLPAVNDLRIDDAMDAVRRDKKVVDGRLHYVLATAIGETAVVDDVTEQELRGALARLGLSNA